MALSTFPSTNSIPPATFFDMNGLPAWLNENPSYKRYFVNFPKLFPYLLTTSTANEYISTTQNADGWSVYNGYSVETVPLAPFVTMMSSKQAREYQDRLALFRDVYGYNSNAYVSSLITGNAPVYYRFATSSDLTAYRTSVGMVERLYPIDAMALAKNESGDPLGWVFPFPISY